MAGSAGSGFDQAVLNGKQGNFSIVAQVEFFQEPEAVGIDGFDADVAAPSHLPSRRFRAG